MSKTTMRLGAATAVLGLALTGCGAAGPSAVSEVAKAADLGEILLASSEQSQDAGSARFSMTMTMAGTDMTAEGAFSYGADGIALEATYDMAMPGGESAEFTMRLVDGALFVSGPEVFGSDQWIGFSGDDAGILGEDFDDLITQLQDAGDPTSGLAQLEEYADLIDEGSDTVDGEPATRYRVTLDLEALAAAVEDIDGLSGAYAELGTAEDAEVMLWVGDDGTIRRLDMTMSVLGEEVVSSMRYFDYGAEVDITAPEADQVISLSDLVPTG